MSIRTLTFAGALFLLVSCGNEIDKPIPEAQNLSDDAIGHFCSMVIAEHPGPKGQVFIDGVDVPLWFSSVRDMVAFTLLPGEPRAIVAMYVNDMGQGADWANPQYAKWIDAKSSLYVIGSRQRGGMEALETVPFSNRTEAEKFTIEFGGEIYAFNDIPEEAVLGNLEIADGEDDAQ